MINIVSTISNIVPDSIYRPHCIKGKQCLKLLDGNKKTTKMKKEVIEKLMLSDLAEVKGGQLNNDCHCTSGAGQVVVVPGKEL